MTRRISPQLAALEGKQLIREAVMAVLYAAPNRQFDERVEAIAKKNMEIGGFRHSTFCYAGKVFKPLQYRNGVKKTLQTLRIPLVPELCPVFEEWYAEQQEIVNFEAPLITAGLNRVLAPCFDAIDVLKLLPESLHKPVLENMTALVSDERLSSDKIAAILLSNAVSLERMYMRLSLNLLI